MTGAPHDLDAEQQLLGMALMSYSVAQHLTEALVPRDFYGPGHQLIAQAIGSLISSGIVHCDVPLVADELGEALSHTGGVPYLVELLGGAGVTSNAEKYAAKVRSLAALRRLQECSFEIDAMIENGTSPAVAIERAKALVAEVELPGAKVEAAPGAITFLARAKTDYNWLVPGLLEEGDRFMLTAGEGVGKSTVLRQMAAQIAVGLHPWDLTPIDPKRVMIVDVENSEAQVSRKVIALRALANHDDLLEENMRIETRTGGLDLLHPADQEWLIGKVEATAPDALVIGPIYKLHTADPNKEEPARTVSALLDRLRTRYGVTLLMETHSPHGGGMGHRPLRPFGASLWMRWPEFGYGMLVNNEDRDECKVVAWRGPRDERDWPAAIVKSNDAERWPWVKAHRLGDEYEQPVLDEEEPF